MRPYLLRLVGTALGAAGLGVLAALHACTPKAGGTDRAPEDGGAPDPSNADVMCGHSEPRGPPDVVDAGGNLDLLFGVAQKCFGTQSKDDAGNWMYQSLGFDLDHTCTGEGQGPSCVEPSSATSTDHTDGPGGVDNAYIQSGIQSGVAVLGVADCVSTRADQLVEMYRVRDYSGAPDDDYVEVSQYFGVGLTPRGDDGGTAPLWDGTDRWPIVPESLAGSPEGGAPAAMYEARYKAQIAYVTGGVLVAQFDAGEVASGVQASLTSLVPVTQLIVTGRLVPPADAGGPWGLPDMVETVRLPVTSVFVTWLLNPSLDGGASPCTSSAAYAMVKDGLCRFVDISSRPGSPTSAPCDAVSSAVLEHMGPALLGEVAPPALPLPSCAVGNPQTDTCP
ncbi:MAG TPA: hypothetical protein VKU41_17740 [Polyangiaceae bacterium]|nr:hypothetical protein [Polyangiaceae bacterium]